MKSQFNCSIKSIKPSNYDFNYHLTVSSFYVNSDLGNIFKNIGLGENLYLILKNDKTELLLSQFYKIPIGLPLILGLPKIFLKLISKINYLNTITCHMQPIITKQMDDIDLSKAVTTVLDFVYTYSLKNKFSVQMDFICFDNLNIVKEITKNKEYLKPCATARINLLKTEIELFENFPKSIKNTLNKRYDIRIEKVDYFTYYQSLKDAWSQKNLSVNNPLYYKLLENLPNNIVHFYLIYSKNNQVLAGSCIGYGNKSAIEFSMFATDYSKQEKIPGGDILKWFLIREAKKNGAEYFDLNMIEINENMDSKSQNINFFKTKWNVDIIYGIKFEMYNSNISFLRKLKYLILGK